MTSLATQTINRCRNLGIELTPTDRGVKCLAPAGTMTPDLQSLIRAKRNDIRDLLLVEASLDDLAAEIDFDTTEPLVPTSPSWPAGVGALADFVMLLTPADLPGAPFELEPHRTIVGVEKYLRALQGDVRRGPSGPRSMTGVLQLELRRLHDMLLAYMRSIS